MISKIRKQYLTNHWAKYILTYILMSDWMWPSIETKGLICQIDKFPSFHISKLVITIQRKQTVLKILCQIFKGVVQVNTFWPPAPALWLMYSGPSFWFKAFWIASCSSVVKCSCNLKITSTIKPYFWKLSLKHLESILQSFRDTHATKWSSRCSVSVAHCVRILLSKIKTND